MQKELYLAERELKIRNYSPKTIKSYLYGLREYFTCKREKFETLNQDNIRDFLILCDQNIRTTQRYTEVTNPKLKNIKSPL